jgi:hypothetical protein
VVSSTHRFHSRQAALDKLEGRYDKDDVLPEKLGSDRDATLSHGSVGVEKKSGGGSRMHSFLDAEDEHHHGRLTPDTITHDMFVSHAGHDPSSYGHSLAIRPLLDRGISFLSLDDDD